MQVYRVFFKILWQQKFILTIYALLFLGICLCFANMGASNESENFSEDKFQIVITDEDHSLISEALYNYLTDIDEVKNIEKTEEKLMDALYARTITAAIVIPKGYGEALLSDNEIKLNMMTIPGTRYATGIEAQVNRFIKPLTAYVCADMDESEAVKNVEETLRVTPKVSFLENANAGGHSFLYYYFQYMPYIVIAIFVIGVGPSVVAFREQNIRTRISASAYPYLQKNMELVLAMFTAGMMFILFLTGIGACIDVNGIFSQKGLLMFINIICFSSVALSVSFLAAAFAKNANILNMVGNVVGLALTFLGGIFVPIEVMGETMENIARFVPTYWYVRAMENIDKTNIDVSFVLLCMAIQISFAIVITAVTLAVLRARKNE